MTKVIKSGNRYNLIADDGIDLRDHLDAGTYAVKQNPDTMEFYLEKVDDFSIPSRLMGDIDANTARILNTFEQRTMSTGVLLSGEKGSGKTLLAKNVSAVAARNSGFPTIIVNQQFHGPAFNELFQLIDQPAVVIFDEFEKIYNWESQEHLLTLFDGVFPTKKLFIVTCNNSYRVQDAMRNRPGRFFYALEYAGLEEAFIDEYCEEFLDQKDQIVSVKKIAAMFSSFNFDMLQALVEEMNRYKEDAYDAVKFLNMNPDSANDDEYEASMVYAGKEVPRKNMHSMNSNGRVSVNPFGEFSLDFSSTNDDGSPGEYREVGFDPSALKEVDSSSGIFKFELTDGTKLSLKRVKPETFNWRAF